MAASSTPRSAAAWGMLFGYATLACVITRNVLLVPLYLSYVSLAEYGAWLATGGTLAQLLVSDFGVGGVVLQRIASRYGANDRDGLAGALGAALSSSLALTGVLTLVGVAVAPLVSSMLNLGPELSGQVTDCFLIALAANAVAVSATVGMSILRGLQRAILPGAITLLAELVLIVVTVIALVEGQGLYALAFGVLARSVCLAVGTFIELLRTAWRRLGLRPRFSRSESVHLLADSASLFAVSISMKVVSKSDVFLIGVILGAVPAAAYGLSTRLIEVATLLLSQATSALAPGLAHVQGRGDQVRFHSLLNRLVPLLAGATFVILGSAVAVSQDFVSLWVGKDQYAGDAAVYVYGIAACVAALGYLAYDALMAAGQFRFIARIYVTIAPIQVLFAMLLLQLGLVGAPLAAAAAACLWGGAFWWRVFQGGSEGRAERPLARRAVLASLVAGAGTLGVARWVLPSAASWGELALHAALIAIALTAATMGSSPWMRRVVAEEADATLRSMRRSP